MTIDEAIEHAEERACDKDQAQLADWLRELRRARMEIDLLKTLRDGFRADAQRYKAENAKLLEERDEWHRVAVSKQNIIDHMRDARAENDKLRVELEDQEGYDQMLRDRLHQQTELCVKAKAENEKLRELVREMYATISDRNSWWDCACKDTTRFSERMREFGIEVG